MEYKLKVEWLKRAHVRTEGLFLEVIKTRLLEGSCCSRILSYVSASTSNLCHLEVFLGCLAFIFSEGKDMAKKRPQKLFQYLGERVTHTG